MLVVVFGEDGLSVELEAVIAVGHHLRRHPFVGGFRPRVGAPNHTSLVCAPVGDCFSTAVGALKFRAYGGYAAFPGTPRGSVHGFEYHVFGVALVASAATRNWRSVVKDYFRGHVFMVGCSAPVMITRSEFWSGGSIL